MKLIGPQAVNAGTTYGRDTSAGNNYGLGSWNRTAAQQMTDAKVSAATAPGFSLWAIAGIIILVLVAL